VNFLIKFNQLSGKLRIAIIISVLWFLFWAGAGLQGGNFKGGLAFGGIPLVLIWGFWWMAISPRKDDDFVEKIQDTLKNGTSTRREFARLEYPTAVRPRLKYGENELEIIDISEKGIKLSNEAQIDLGRVIHGEAILLSGRSVHVDGEVAWSLNNEVGLLMALIPGSIIAEEKRVLAAYKP
jgi:hypothetical protein